MTTTEIPYQQYEDRLGEMLKEVIDSGDVVPLGRVGVNWWKFGMATSETTQSARNQHTEAITFRASYVLSTIKGGNKGPTQKDYNKKVNIIKIYFIARANMITSTQAVRSNYINGMIPGSLRAKFVGARTTDKHILLDFTFTVKHLLTIKRIED